MKIRLIVRKNMLTKRFPELATGTIVCGINTTTNAPCLYIDKVEAANLAGQIIEAIKEDGSGITMQELAVLVKKPHSLVFDTAVATNQAEVSLEIIEMTKAASSTIDLDKEVQRLVDEGICSKAEAELKVSVMKQNRFSDNLIQKVLQANKNYSLPVRTPKAMYRDTNPKGTGISVLAKCMSKALMGHAVIYEGDKSVGKNVAAETVAWLLNAPFFLTSFNKRTTMSELAGEKTTKQSTLSTMTEEELVKKKEENPALAAAIVAKGQTIELVTEESELIRWMRNGGVIMLNEVNMADSNFLQSFLNPLADGTGFVEFPGHGRVELHPDCILIGSQNPDYSGAQQQNAATLSRLGKIYFPYPDSIVEALKAATVGLGLNDKVYNMVDKLYKTFYKAATNGSGTISDKVLNIRGFVRALETYANFGDMYPLNEAIKTDVAAWADIDEVNVINTYIDDIITI